MGETENKNTAVKESWFAGLKAEFKKSFGLQRITCPSDNSSCYCVSCTWSDNYTSGYTHPVRCEFSSEFIMEA